MNKIKKITLLLTIVLLAGCTAAGSKEPAATETSDPTETEIIVPTETAVPIEIPTEAPTTTATVEPAETPVPTKNWQIEGKAKGFDYDIENLNYELVWSDEFDYVGKPDSEKWGYDVGGSGWGNNELQYYTAGDNAEVDGEKLIIEARKESKGGNEYTSTRLISKNKGDWLYGKVEVSAKLPAGKGTWPAIWMLPTDWKYGSWPDSGEIDIMEHVGYDMNNVHGTVHTKAYNHMIGTQVGNGMIVNNVDTEFHKYSVEWLPDKMRFFIDDIEYFVFEPSEYMTVPTYKQWPFDQRFHLLINIALGGSWGGAQGFDPDIYPVTMEVDYVRVYQAQEINGLINISE